MNLIDLINQQKYDFFYLAIDEHLSIKLPELKNFHCLTPESFSLRLDIKNSGKFLDSLVVQNFITNTSQATGNKVAVIPFKPSAKILKICQNNQWLCLSNPPQINRLFEDKIKFTNICKTFNIPLINHLILPFNQSNYQFAQQKFGKKLVLQTHFGWAGNSTFFSQDFRDIVSKITVDVPTKFMPLLDGYTLLNNCCLTKDGLIQSPVALQFTGLKPLTHNPFTTVGRQWPSPAPDNIHRQLQVITSNFSKILQKYRYLGFFGLDFLVTQDKVYLLECNPRLTASFGFYTRLEINQKLNPLFLFHICQFLTPEFNFDINKEQRADNHQIIGTELTKKNDHSQTIEKIQMNSAITNNCYEDSISPSILEKFSK